MYGKYQPSEYLKLQYNLNNCEAYIVFFFIW